MSFVIRFNLCDCLFLKDPQETELGRRIIRNSIELIDDLGFESFTFKKLAKQINTTEASVYRYFENKHLLLIYLVSWYWEWVRYLIQMRSLNIKDPKESLLVAIDNIIQASMENPDVEYVNENLLHRIVIAEGSKAYHTKHIDEENKDGMFLSYKELCQMIADIVIEVKPDFLYPRSLASNLLEMANNQVYFARHLPRLTDIMGNDEIQIELRRLMVFFAFKLLDVEQESQ